MGLVGAMPRADLVREASQNTETLASASPEILADELIANAAANWAQAGAAGLARLPMLILSSRAAYCHRLWRIGIIARAFVRRFVA